jgi:lysophospholipase L1-like esterase
VINGGVPSYNVVENLLHYELLLESLEPRVVILYVGINDVHPRLFGTLKPDYANSRAAWRPGANLFPAVSEWLRGAYPYRYLILRQLDIRTFFHIDHVVQQPYPSPGTWDAALRRNGPGVYRRHLEDLVRLLRAQGKRVLVVPQIFIARPAVRGDDVFKRGVQEHNEVNEAVAREFEAGFTAAVSDAAFEPDDLLPNDPCHFTPAGHERMAALLFEAVASDGVTPDDR